MNSGNQIWDEADIGSGEKTAGQHETEALIRQIPPLPHGAGENTGKNTGEADAAAAPGDEAGRASTRPQAPDKNEADHAAAANH